MSETNPTALDLGRAFARQERDPVAWIEEALERAAVSEAVFISLDTDRARCEAEAASARVRAGRPLGPLDGVPLAWKDLFDVAGSITSVGGTVHTDTAATRDAACVRKAMSAGLVTFGKTNLSELAYSGLGLNPHYGTPHATPGDGPARVPGGSSSGSAVAVALGIVPVATGTDTGGSLRVPAAFNGIVGYRPSQARHDPAGMRFLARTLDTLGAMAGNVADCAAADDCLRGTNVIERMPSSPQETVLVLDRHMLEDPALSDSVRHNLLQAAERLRAAGFVVVERPVAVVRETLDNIRERGWLGAVEAYAEHRTLLDSPAADGLDRRVRDRLGLAREIGPDTVVEMYRSRRRLIDAFRAELGPAVLLTPTVAHVAPLLAPVADDPALFAKINLATLRLTMVASVLDCPAVAMPSGRDVDGQFTSLQLSAPRGDDERLLRVALAVEQALAHDA